MPQREKSPPKKDHKIYNLPTLQKVADRKLKEPPKRSSVYRDDSTDETDTETETESEDEIDKVRH